MERVGRALLWRARYTGELARGEERVKRAGQGEERPDERSRSLEALATELSQVVAKVPPRVAHDAGATPELIAALRLSAEVVLTARGAAQGARGTVTVAQMNTLLAGLGVSAFEPDDWGPLRAA